eukprot:TRINITY_DN12203_c0_g1_i1.p1 TRINITY_DN12203_c0_g1~~TRINITY_DN12203_c0_g1_i1.p1  ORF type:complete len:283 (-),score=55.55 TRINITY_DN12203_c0_g1_i1:531-1346(-)
MNDHDKRRSKLYTMISVITITISMITTTSASYTFGGCTDDPYRILLNVIGVEDKIKVFDMREQITMNDHDKRRSKLYTMISVITITISMITTTSASYTFGGCTDDPYRILLNVIGVEDKIKVFDMRDGNLHSPKKSDDAVSCGSEDLVTEQPEMKLEAVCEDDYMHWKLEFNDFVVFLEHGSMNFDYTNSWYVGSYLISELYNRLYFLESGVGWYHYKGTIMNLDNTSNLRDWVVDISEMDAGLSIYHNGGRWNLECDVLEYANNCIYITK